MTYMPKLQKSDLVVDNTILSAVATCHTKAAMEHVLGLKTSEEAKELRCGSAVHEALAWWLCKQPVPKALERFDLAYKGWAQEHVPGDDRLAWRTVRRILTHWFQTHPLDKWPLVVKPEEVEVPIGAVLAEDIRGHRVVMVALLDALAKSRTGGRYSLDHKSTSRTGDYFKRRQDDSSQFSGQLWLARERDIPLSGVYINGVELPNLPGSDRKCARHGVPYSECGVTHANHVLFPVTRAPAELDAWAGTARKLAAQFIRLQERVQSVEDIPSIPMQGRFNGGCGFCSLREWCEMGRPKGAVRSMVREKWDPLAHAQRHVDAIADARAQTA